MEIDHAFICARAKAPEGDALRAFGLIEGSGNTHPGQGTANRRFFFENFMLELLWLENAAEAQSATTRPMTLYERCNAAETSASPLGLAFRPSDGEASMAPPFSAWDYRPRYLPRDLAIMVAEGLSLREPLIFYLPFAARPRRTELFRDEPVSHPVGWKNLTALSVTVPQSPPFSPGLRAVDALTGCSVGQGETPLLVLEFDGGGQGLHKDFTPLLPLRCRW